MRTEDHNPSGETGSSLCHNICSFELVDFCVGTAVVSFVPIWLFRHSLVTLGLL